MKVLMLLLLVSCASHTPEYAEADEFMEEDLETLLGSSYVKPLKKAYKK